MTASVVPYVAVYRCYSANGGGDPACGRMTRGELGEFESVRVAAGVTEYVVLGGSAKSGLVVDGWVVHVGAWRGSSSVVVNLLKCVAL